MEAEELKYFELLKKEISETMRKEFPGTPALIEDWRGQHITDFQEELFRKVKGRISEKWFYTHIKSTSDKLPRIDMLNMLSEYTGYKNWDEFVNAKKNDSPPTVETRKTDLPTQDIPRRQKRIPLVIAACIIGISATLFFLFPRERVYKCCFVDLDGISSFKNMNIKIQVLHEGETPSLLESGENGCIEIKTNREEVRFTIASPYFMNDTIVRKLTASRVEEKIQLKTNDYALMLSYFSTSNLADWKKRKAQLEEMFADNARIFQVYTDTRAVELYNKQEFINKLTVPLESLKNIDIIDIRYAGRYISELHFKQSIRINP